MLKVALFIGSTVLILNGCTTIGAGRREASTLLNGTWDNSAQMAAAPEALKRPPAAGGAYEWIDGQYATFFPANVPALTADGSKAIYLVWRNGGPTGTISRQRLWVFRTGADGQVGMDFYAFKNPQAFQTATGNNEVFKTVTQDDLTAYGPLCTLPVVPTPTGWTAAIPDTCSITARSGRKMVLSAQIVVDGETVSYNEQGILESGALAFKVPGGPAYRFVRKKGKTP